MQIVEIGDSRTYGNADVASQNYLGLPSALGPNYNGNSFTTPVTVSLSGGVGTGGQLGAVINPIAGGGSGLILYPIHRGSGYRSTSMPTIVLTGANASTVSFDWTYVNNNPAG